VLDCLPLKIGGFVCDSKTLFGLKIGACAFFGFSCILDWRSLKLARVVAKLFVAAVEVVLVFRGVFVVLLVCFGLFGLPLGLTLLTGTLNSVVCGARSKCGMSTGFPPISIVTSKLESSAS